MLNPILRRAARVRGDEPALICHIGTKTAPKVKKRWLREHDRVLDLDQACGTPDLPATAGPEDPSALAGFAVLIAATMTDLRRAAALGPWLPRAAHITVVLSSVPAHRGPPLPAPPGQNQWRDLEDMNLRRHAKGGWSLEMFFLDPMPLGEVAGAVARGQGGARHHAVPAPLVALAPPPGEAGPAAAWRPGDPGTTAAPPQGPVATLRVTPAADLVLRPADSAPEARPPWTDERVSLVDQPGPAALSGGGDDPPDLERLTPDDLPPVDERTVNPEGFRYSPQRGFGRLFRSDGRWRLVQGAEELLTVPESGTVTDTDLDRLRPLRGVRIEWGEQPGPAALLRAVAGLAAGGVPLTGAAPPAWTAALGTGLRELIGSLDETDLRDDLRREEHSVRLRRAALRTHGARARWRSLGERHGVPPPPEPLISVVLCTRRPEMVGFGLRQIARQRHVTLEAVLTLHGFETDAPGVSEAITEFRACGHALTVLPVPGDVIYGQALNRAVARAGGSLLAKMDDDDWYGPEHLADLLLAREYSGAEVTGCGQEFVFLEDLDLTVRRGTVSECAWRYIAGGGLLIGRGALEEAGGFRPLPRAIDTQLLTAVTNDGGRIYRTHSLGYVLRRKPAGHTWSEGTGYFLRRTVQQRQGWAPSALLEAEPRDEPDRPAAPAENIRDMTGVSR